MSRTFYKLLTYILIFTFIITFFLYPSLKFANIYNNFDGYNDVAYIEFPSFANKYVMDINGYDSNNKVQVSTVAYSDKLTYGDYTVLLSMPLMIGGVTYANVNDYLSKVDVYPWERHVTTTGYLLGEYGGYFPTDFADVFYLDSYGQGNYNDYFATHGYYKYYDSQTGQPRWDLHAPERKNAVLTALPLYSADIETYIGTPYTVNNKDVVDVFYYFTNVKVIPNGIMVLESVTAMSKWFDLNKPQVMEWSNVDSASDMLSFLKSYMAYPFKWVSFAIKNIRFTFSSFNCFL